MQKILYSLTHSQTRLWFEWKLNPRNCAYNNPLLYELNGDLNVKFLEKAIQYVVQKRSALRVKFVEKNGIPYQTIEEKMEMHLSYFDLFHLNDDEKAQEKDRLISANVSKQFDLYEPPLFRFSLIKCNFQQYFFVLNIHHIAVDGYSATLLLEDISFAYQHLLHALELPEESDLESYLNFINWEIQELSSQYQAEASQYWQAALENVETHTTSLVSFSKIEVNNFSGERIHLSLSADEKKQLHQFARKQRTTPFLLILTIFSILLRKYTEQKEIVLSYPVDIRGKLFKNLFGCYINTLPIAISYSEDISFIDLLNQITHQRKSDREYEFFPTQFILDALRDKKEINQLYNVSCIRANFALSGLKLDAVTIKPLPIFTNSVKDDLTILFDESEGLEFELEYRKSKYDKFILEQFINHFKYLLIELPKNPYTNISKINLITPYEIQKIEKRFNRLNSRRITSNSFIKSFENSAKLFSDKMAVKDADTQISYFKLNQLANQIANYLLAKNFRKGQHVVICLQRNIYLVASLLAIQKIGCVYIPLDTEYPTERLDFILEQSDANFLISQYTKEISNPNKLNCQNILISEIINSCSSLDKENLKDVIDNELPIYMIYTSGSTGQPKGVVITNHNLINFLESMQNLLPLSSEDIFLAITTISFDISGLELYLPLLLGAKLVLGDKNTANNFNKIITTIEKEKITTLQATPANWQLLVDNHWKGAKNIKALCGGELLSKSLADNLIPLVGELWNLYGPTETTIWSMLCKVGAREQIHLGSPIDNTSIFLLDKELNLVPRGIVGEIYIAGKGLAKGYFKRDTLTEKSFFEWSQKNFRIYKTGDQAVLTNDYKLIYINRTDYQIKLRGYRIELQEIERLIESHPAINQCIVQLQNFGQNDSRLTAYYTMQSGAELSENDLQIFLRPKLPHYMVPANCIAIDRFPLTMSGKINRTALITMRTTTDRLVIEPRNPIEKYLQELWKKILKIEKISISDNFFNVGGHSLLANQVLAHIFQDKKQIITLNKFFEEPTIVGLANLMLNPKAEKPITTKRKHEDNIISFEQMRILFLNQLQQDVGQYNISFTINFITPFNSTALLKALQTIVKENEILRSCFKFSQDGMPFQCIANEVNYQLYFFEEFQEDNDESIENHAKQIFNLSNSPLFRFRLIHSSKSDLLVCVFHHIIFDGYSINIFIQRLSELYFNNTETFALEKENKKANLQYIDYANWSHDYLLTEQSKIDLEFWMKELQGYTNTFLPTDFQRPQHLAFNGDEIEIEIPEHIVQQLKISCKINGVSLFVELITAYLILIYKLTRQQDLCIGIPASIRPTIEFQNLVGCFINNLPFRISLSESISYQEILHRVKLITSHVLTHQLFPFDKIVNALKIPYNSASNPLFNLMFNFQEVQLENDVEIFDGMVERINNKTSKYDITFEIYAYKNKLKLIIQYATHLFKKETILNLAQYYQLILKNILQDKFVKISDIFNEKFSATKYIYIPKCNEVKKISYINPKTVLEQDIAKLWQKYLKVDKIGLTENFFECGGHSFLATQMILQINQIYRVSLPLITIFEANTLEQFTNKLELLLNSSEKTANNFNTAPKSSLQQYQLASKSLGMLYISEKSNLINKYNVAFAISLTGKLDKSLLQLALNKAVAKHEALRAYFIKVSNTYVGCTAEINLLPITEIDFENVKHDDINQYLNHLINLPFKLSVPPLYKIYLIKFSKEKFILLWVSHHIICDEWSLYVLLREISYSYNNKLDTLNNSVASLADYNLDLLKTKNTPEYLKRSVYWQEKLQQVLPTKLPQQKLFSGKYLEHSILIPKDEVNLIKTFSNKNNTTLFLTLLVGFTCILSKYTNEQNICIGTVTANRENPNYADSVGFFIEIVPLYFEWTKDATGYNCLEEISKQFRKAFLNLLPYPDVVSIYRKTAQNNHVEPVDMLFIMNHTFPAPTFNGLSCEIRDITHMAGEYELVVILKELEDNSVQIKIEYKDCFSEKFISNFSENYRIFLQDFIKNFDKSFQQLDLYETKKLQNLLPRKYHTETKTFLDFFIESVNKYSTKTAIYCNQQEISFQELDAKSNQIAINIQNFCDKNNIKLLEESIIAVSAGPNIDFIATILAIFKLGATYLPIDKQIPKERLEYFLSDSRALLLITSELEIEKENRTSIPIVYLENISKSETVKKYLPVKQLSPKLLAYIIYTSGSTGTPKGVLIEHHSLLNLVKSIQEIIHLSQQDRMLQFSSIGFDASIWEIFVSLSIGGTLFIPTAQERLVGKSLENFISKHQITTTILPPSVLQRLNPLQIPTLTKIAVGGESCHEDILEKWTENRRLFNAYGPTEATVCASITELKLKSSVSIGETIRNASILLLDSNLKMVPFGCIGEICLAGANIARGYINPTSHNNANFTVFTDANLMTPIYRTGDFARYAEDNVLVFCGRKDRQVKIRGIRINLTEIEKCILKIDSIKETFVYLDEQDKLISFYSANSQLNEKIIITQLNNFLPRYMIPQVFIYRDKFPFTNNDKLDINMLKSQMDFPTTIVVETHINQLTTLQNEILECWGGILNTKISSIKQDFFSLGGNSLQIMEILAEFNEKYDLQLTMKVFFNNPTILELSYYIESIMIPTS